MPTKTPTENLLRACRLGQETAALRALGDGADASAQLPWGTPLDVDGAGHTALMLAAGSGMERVAKALMAAGARPNDAGIRGRTPLERSVGHPEVLRLLLESGADPNRKNDFGRTALMEACGLRAEPAKIPWSESRRTKMHVPDQAPSTNREQALDSIRQLLAKGADASAEDSGGRTPAFFCVASGNCDALREVAAAGGNISSISAAARGDKDRFSPIWLACAYNKAAELECLIELGADVASPTEDGGLAMYEAVKGKYSRCVELLLSAGAAPNRDAILEKLNRDIPFKEQLIKEAMASFDAVIEARELSLAVRQVDGHAEPATAAAPIRRRI